MSNQPDPILVSESCVHNKHPGLLSVTSRNLVWRPEGRSTPSLVVSVASVKAIHVNSGSSDRCLLKITANEEHLFQFTDVASRERVKTVLADRQGKTKPGLSRMPRPNAALWEKLLSNDPELARLHRELVDRGTMTEDEFWSTRKYLINTRRVLDTQNEGIPSSMVSDIRPTVGIGGEVKYTLTPSIIHRIFSQYPGVRRAYRENVPHNLSEKDFWTQYFQSKLFNRTDARETILDQYKIEDLEAKFEDCKVAKLHSAVDLKATEEDHICEFLGIPSPDPEPLVRKFNRHSGFVLNAIGAQVEPYHQPGLDDLEEKLCPAYAELDLPDKREHFAQVVENTQDDNEMHPDRFIEQCIAWANVRKIKFPSLQSLEDETTDSCSPHPIDIPTTVLDFYSNINEILRHFWSCYPPKTLEQRDKLLKMVVLLKSGYSTYQNLTKMCPSISSLGEVISTALSRSANL